MDTMVEKVRLAISPYLHDQITSFAALDAAMAVFDAIRWPTDAMVEAMAVQIDHAPFGRITRGVNPFHSDRNRMTTARNRARCAYQAAIESALSLANPSPTDRGG